MAGPSTAELPPPGAPDLGAPPPLRRDGGTRPAGPVGEPGARGGDAALAESAPAPAPAVTQAPGRELPVLALATALASTAVGLWLERRLGR